MERSLLESEFGSYENLTDGRTLVLYYVNETPLKFTWNNVL
ncbi:hypothetical protein BLA29_015286, partial [Euroglyphus maynei]